MTGCTVVWLPGKDDFSKALRRLGFQPPSPGPRILNPRGVPSIPAAAPLQAGSEGTPAGGTPRTGRSPTPGGSAQRPRRGTRSTPAAPAPPPAVPLHNLRLLLRSMEAVLRRDEVCPLLTRLDAFPGSAMVWNLVSLAPQMCRRTCVVPQTHVVRPAPCRHILGLLLYSSRKHA